MKTQPFFRTFLILFLLCNVSALAQELKPDLSKIEKSDHWIIENRAIKVSRQEVYLDAADGDGLVWTDEIDFANGIIEVDLKGKDVQGASFVGIAFHLQNEDTFEGIYFRPFNFQNPERNNHSVQYIYMPDYDWSKLREEHPGVYENVISPAPQPNEWLHAKIEVNYPSVKVYVNGAASPSLEVTQIGKQQSGKIGLWVGNGSDGYFKNLKIHLKK